MEVFFGSLVDEGVGNVRNASQSQHTLEHLSPRDFAKHPPHSLCSAASCSGHGSMWAFRPGWKRVRNDLEKLFEVLPLILIDNFPRISITSWRIRSTSCSTSGIQSCLCLSNGQNTDKAKLNVFF
jgi:hypothetical protein